MAIIVVLLPENISYISLKFSTSTVHGKTLVSQPVVQCVTLIDHH